MGNGWQKDGVARQARLHSDEPPASLVGGTKTAGVRQARLQREELERVERERKRQAERLEQEANAEQLPLEPKKAKRKER